MNGDIMHKMEQLKKSFDHNFKMLIQRLADIEMDVSSLKEEKKKASSAKAEPVKAETKTKKS